MKVSSLTPMDSSKSTPTRRRMAISCGCVLRPAPRPVSSSGLRSNTTTSQPALRKRCAANSPPRVAMARICLGGACSCHGPGNAVVARPVVAIALRRVAVDERPAIERMGLAAHLVLHGEQHFARIEIDDILEAVFVVVDL